MAELLRLLPPGVALAVLGAAFALRGGVAGGLAVLVGVCVEAARLAVALPAAELRPFVGDGLARTGSVAALAVVAVVAVASLGRRERGSVASLLLAGASVAAVQAGDLRVLAPLLLAVAVLELVLVPGVDGAGRDPASGRPTSSAHGWRAAALVGLASPALVALGTHGRVSAGGTTALEWVGRPFAGDPPSTLLFAGLVLPIVLPPALGGSLHALRAGPPAAGGGAYVHAGLLRSLVLAVSLGRCFAGAAPLAGLGAAVALLAVPVGLLGPRSSAQRLSVAVHASLGVLVAGIAVGTEASLDALGLGAIGLALAASGSAIGLEHATCERARDPGLGPRGLGRLFPSVFLFTSIGALGLAALPGTLAFAARSRELGSFAREGEGVVAVALAVSAAPVLALAVLPFLAAVFLSSAPRAGAAGAPLRRAPVALHAALALAGAGAVALGLVPGALDGLLPYGAGGPDRFPGVLATFELLLGGALVALLRARARLSSHAGDGARLSSSP